MRRGWLALVLAAMLWPAAAEAAWVKAETERFIVYGEGREAAVKALAVRLTTYDRVLRAFNSNAGPPPPSRKLEVYMVHGTRELRRVVPRLHENIRGFYAASPERVFAMVDPGENNVLGADGVLFHEYAHHFMLENFPAAYPTWFVEGWAEFFMTAEFTRDGVKVGGYNPARVAGLFLSSWLPIETMLGKSLGDIKSAQDRSQFYGQAWLLMHYMRDDKKRAQAMDKAVVAIAKGEDPVQTVLSAAGMTAAELTRALRNYRSLQILLVPNDDKGPPEVKLTTLSDGEGAFLLDHLAMARGLNSRDAPALLAGVRRRAAAYPGDHWAELALARAEMSWGDVAVGEALLNRRLAASPADAETLLLAGISQMEAGARDKAARVDRYRAARKLLGEAFKAGGSDPRILFAYAVARSLEPGYPTDNDLNVLIEAQHRAPAVHGMRLLVAQALIAKDHRAEAAIILAPVINSPHGGRLAERARKLMEGGKVDDAAKDDGDDDDDAAVGTQPAR